MANFLKDSVRFDLFFCSSESGKGNLRNCNKIATCAIVSNVDTWALMTAPTRRPDGVGGLGGPHHLGGAYSRFGLQDID